MPFVGIGVGIGRQRFASGIFAAYAARVAADGGVTEAGACVNAVSGISLNSSLLLVPSGYKSGVVYSEIPTNGDGDLTFTRASDATRVNSDGEIEVVGSGVPRLDYSQGSCPALLLEPQRTNLVTYSEEFDNAAWLKTLATITANTTTSPDGTTTADLFVPASGSTGRFEQNTGTAAVNNTVYTGSIYFKNPTLAIDNITFYISSGGALGGHRFGITVDLTNFTGAVFNFGNGVTTSVSVVSVGNDWYRAIFTGSVTSGATGNWAFVARVLTTNATIDGTNGLLIWGAQMELAAYATSYIPTTSATVTRLADACSKTGISSLIGQTEGTVLVEFSTNNLETYTRRLFSLSDGSNPNQINLQIQANTTTLTFAVIDGGSVQAVINTSTNFYTLGSLMKIAVAYKENDFAFYANGNQIGVDTLGSVPTCSEFKFADPLNASKFVGGISQALLFTTRLSNAELAELTTL